MNAPAMTKTQKTENWEQFSDEEILQMRVRDLGLQIGGSVLEPLIDKLYEELDAKGIQFHPPCYLADEWLCPDKVPIIGIPFCLAQPRLKHIEQKMMFEVEGGDEESFMRLLRHECGHAINYAYQLYRRTQWRELFGPFTATYSDFYYYQPYSRRYVMHLRYSYAQSHPDEDFAETFAAWLAPNSSWGQKYHGWPVIKKLQYVDGLMKRIGKLAPVVTARERPPWSAARMTSTLAAYYERKRKALGTEFKGFYDNSLSKLFSATGADPSSPRASKLLRAHRRELVNSVTRWTGHRKYDIHQLVNNLARRCDALGLRAPAGQTESIIGITSLLTTIASNTLSAERRRRHR